MSIDRAISSGDEQVTVIIEVSSTVVIKLFINIFLIRFMCRLYCTDDEACRRRWKLDDCMHKNNGFCESFGVFEYVHRRTKNLNKSFRCRF